MATSQQSIFRAPILLLAVADVVLLGWRLWPLQGTSGLPANITTAADPFVILTAYIALSIWIGTARSEHARKALFSAGVIGFISGLFVAGQVFIASLGMNGDVISPDRIQIALLVVAGILWGIAGWNAARGGNVVGFAVVCSAWAAMLGCLMGCAALLAQGYIGSTAMASPDPWKDYEGLAIGTPAMQALVHTLNLMNGFLLLGPIAACVAGLLFASVAKPKND